MTHHEIEVNELLEPLSLGAPRPLCWALTTFFVGAALGSLITYWICA